MKHVLAIDQGTTGTTVILFDETGTPVKRAYREFTQHYPQPGWVEHDALEIWETVCAGIRECCSGEPPPIEAIGITNQRETSVVWDRTTGAPVYNAIVWQCRRTAGFCDTLMPHQEMFKSRTGLPVDAYFSGTKINWILNHAAIESTDNLLCGTIDSWLIWKLSGGATHATDYTNASRTLIYNIHKREWDPELCGLLDIPLSMLPDVRSSKGDFGVATGIAEIEGIPITGVAGDQQAALFGQGCFEPGELKNTYGTGCFIMMNTGEQAVTSEGGLITTLAVNGEGEPCYALEGSIFIAGAAIQWLRDELGLIQHASESEAAARAVADNAGVYLVPAFVGLGAPHWEMDARGTLCGLTRGSNRNHIIRAALESMAYQTHDVVRLMERESGFGIPALAVDGGAAANHFLLQFQADILNTPIFRPANIESTSFGAAALAGLYVGVWENAAKIKELKSIEKRFEPSMDEASRNKLLTGWQHALRQAMTP